MKVTVAADARYRVDRKFVRQYVVGEWLERNLPDGLVSISFIGTRKSRQLSKKYLNDDAPHPVITVPYGVTSDFPSDGSALADIIICFPQVVLFASSQNKSVDTVIKQFIDHSLTILSQQWREK